MIGLEGKKGNLARGPSSVGGEREPGGLEREQWTPKKRKKKTIMWELLLWVSVHFFPGVGYGSVKSGTWD